MNMMLKEQMRKMKYFPLNCKKKKTSASNNSEWKGKRTTEGVVGRKAYALGRSVIISSVAVYHRAVTALAVCHHIQCGCLS
jgi:hypothetical protein